MNQHVHMLTSYSSKVRHRKGQVVLALEAIFKYSVAMLGTSNLDTLKVEKVSLCDKSFNLRCLPLSIVTHSVDKVVLSLPLTDLDRVYSLLKHDMNLLPPETLNKVDIYLTLMDSTFELSSDLISLGVKPLIVTQQRKTVSKQNILIETSSFLPHYLRLKKEPCYHSFFVKECSFKR